MGRPVARQQYPQGAMPQVPQQQQASGQLPPAPRAQQQQQAQPQYQQPAQLQVPQQLLQQQTQATRHYAEGTVGYPEASNPMEQPLSPGGSTATLLMQQQVLAPDLSKADVVVHLTSRMLAVEEACGKLDKRIDECFAEQTNFCTLGDFQNTMAQVQSAIQEVQEELPRLRQDDAAQVADIRALAEKQDQIIAEFRDQCIAEQHGREALTKEIHRSAQDLEALLRKCDSDSQARIAQLERGLSSEEAERRDSHEKLTQTFREQLTQEAERLQASCMRLESTIMREMRERMDSQRTLREELQVQQQALVRLSPRVDDLLMELRAELPRLTQEFSMLKANLDRTEDTLGVSVARLEQLDQTLSEETTTRAANHDTLARDLGNKLAKETSTLSNHVAALQTAQLKLQDGVDNAKANAADAAEKADALRQEAANMRELQAQTSAQLQLLRDGTEEQFESVKEELRSFREWTDTEIVSHIGTLDNTVKREMSERKEVSKEIDARLSKNSERWCQLQAKFDDILLADAAAQRRSGWDSIKSGQAVTTP